MSFLSSNTLTQILPDVIEGYNQELVRCGSYELCLGTEFFTTDSKSEVKETRPEGGQLVIKPGQFALLITKEKITLPEQYIAFISIKYRIKKKGLINISGFHVDPGFKGKLTFSVYNAGSKNIVLTVGDPTFLIWFSTLDENANDPYDGEHQGQISISSEDVMASQGEIASPAYLSSELSSLKLKQNIQWGILIAILMIFITLLLKDVFSGNNGKNAVQENTIKTPTIEKLDKMR